MITDNNHRRRSLHAGCSSRRGSAIWSLPGVLGGLVVGSALSACGAMPDDGDPSVEVGTAALSLTNGRVAYYRFEQGDARDSSGNGHHGAGIGNPSFPAERGGRTVRLDGTQSISIPSSPALSPASTLTACAWVKPEVLSWPKRILELGSGGYAFELRNGRVEFRLPGQSAVHWALSNGYVRVHEWNHVCGTTNGVTARIYINGALDKSFAAPNALRVLNEPLFIGAKRNATPIEHLQGYIDDVAIYSRALSGSEVATLYQEGRLAPPATVQVSCAVPGKLYLNGHATGQTCPATLQLPTAGHYWVGLGSERPGYQHKEVFVHGSEQLQVSFADSGWLPRKDWKILVYSLRNVDFPNGKFGRLSNASIAAAVASAEQTNEWVIPYSYGLVGWDVDSFVDEQTTVQAMYDSGGRLAVNADQVLQIAGNESLKAAYDHIFVYFPAAFATDGTEMGGCCGGATGGKMTHIPDTYGVYLNWREKSGNNQIWLHEWLHGAEHQLGALMGWPLGTEALHGGEIHGYSSDPNLHWLPFYRDFMRGLVPENGRYVGLSPVGFVESRPLERTLLVRSLDGSIGGGATVTAKIELTSSWATGYCANVTVRNVGTAPTSSWNVRVNMNQSTLQHGWSASFTTQAGELSIASGGWNGAIAPNGSHQAGFCANRPGAHSVPVIVMASGS